MADQHPGPTINCSHPQEKVTFDGNGVGVGVVVAAITDVPVVVNIPNTRSIIIQKYSITYINFVFKILCVSCYSNTINQIGGSENAQACLSK
jgi:hypothetical protein